MRNKYSNPIEWRRQRRSVLLAVPFAYNREFIGGHHRSGMVCFCVQYAEDLPKQ